MDTPIYTELQQKLIDPEANNWGPSAPPEFAEELAEHEDQAAADSGKDAKNGSTGRATRGRRHRAED